MLAWPLRLAFLRGVLVLDRKSTRLNSSHVRTSYAVFCLKKKKAVLSEFRLHGDRRSRGANRPAAVPYIHAVSLAQPPQPSSNPIIGGALSVASEASAGAM